MGSVACLALYVFSESPSSTELHTSLTHLSTDTSSLTSLSITESQLLLTCMWCIVCSGVYTSCTLCVIQFKCLHTRVGLSFWVTVSQAQQECVWLVLLCCEEQGSLLFSTAGGPCCLETTASCRLCFVHPNLSGCFGNFSMCVSVFASVCCCLCYLKH